VVDANGLSPKQAGAGLADIAQATLPAVMTQVYPRLVPPLRSDRDTILVGKMSARGKQKIRITGTAAGKPVKWSWMVSPERSSEDQANLPLRRKKFAAIDLAKRGGAEEKILTALEDTTTLEFIETPLQDVKQNRQPVVAEIQLKRCSTPDCGEVVRLADIDTGAVQSKCRAYA
jgi:hypothetical protein